MTPIPDYFLRAILDAPDDDEPRLQFCDWLDENDVPATTYGRGFVHTDGNGFADRAEFIRVQIALTQRKGIDPKSFVRNENGRLVSNDSIADKLKARSSELIRICTYPANGWVWAGEPLNRIDDAEYNYNRGFINWAKMTASQWLSHGDTITAQHPVEAVTLTTTPAGYHVNTYDPHNPRWHFAWALPTRRFYGAVDAGPNECMDEMKKRWPRIKFTLSPERSSEWPEIRYRYLRQISERLALPEHLTR